MNFKLTRTQKDYIRAYVIERERNQGFKVTRIRFLSDGDVRAYCEDGYTYLVAPTAVLIEEAFSA
jgi:hypothetical protein